MRWSQRGNKGAKGGVGVLTDYNSPGDSANIPGCVDCCVNHSVVLNNRGIDFIGLHNNQGKQTHDNANGNR